jgi:hypothetical protein
MASFTGKWKVISSPDFDDEYLHVETEPYIIEGILMGAYRLRVRFSSALRVWMRWMKSAVVEQL